MSDAAESQGRRPGCGRSGLGVRQRAGYLFCLDDGSHGSALLCRLIREALGSPAWRQGQVQGRPVSRLRRDVWQAGHRVGGTRSFPLMGKVAERAGCGETRRVWSLTARHLLSLAAKAPVSLASSGRGSFEVSNLGIGRWKTQSAISRDMARINGVIASSTSSAMSCKARQLRHRGETSKESDVESE